MKTLLLLSLLSVPAFAGNPYEEFANNLALRQAAIDQTNAVNEAARMQANASDNAARMQANAIDDAAKMQARAIENQTVAINNLEFEQWTANQAAERRVQVPFVSRCQYSLLVYKDGSNVYIESKNGDKIGPLYINKCQ